MQWNINKEDKKYLKNIRALLTSCVVIFLVCPVEVYFQLFECDGESISPRVYAFWTVLSQG